MLLKILFIILLFKYVSLIRQEPQINVPNIDELVNSPLLKQGIQKKENTLVIGSCKIALDRYCPDPDVTFYLYSQTYPENPEPVRIGSDVNVSNLAQTSFNPYLPTKIVIHGYNSDMFLTVLTEIRKEYLRTKNYNIFAVDWSPLAMGPCYPAAVWNARHAGTCAAQLIERLREYGVTDLHVIGFSLGAHVTNFIANALAPYKIPRITGLDPAMPGFITVGPENKLDKTDAEFVDVLHTNAFIQGQVQESGHVDFYLNGGVIQPGCWAENRFFACNHHRAPLYFAESINTRIGFWGWPCPSYVNYLLARCPPRDPQVIMGENVDRSTRGVYLVITDSVTPFAVGKFTGPAIEILLKSEQNRMEILTKFKKQIMDYVDEDSLIDEMYSSNNDKNSNNVMAQLNKEFMDTLFPLSNNFTDSLEFFF